MVCGRAHEIARQLVDPHEKRNDREHHPVEEDLPDDAEAAALELTLCKARCEARDDSLHLLFVRAYELFDDHRERAARIAHFPLHQLAMDARRRADKVLEHGLDPHPQHRDELWTGGRIDLGAGWGRRGAP